MTKARKALYWLTTGIAATTLAGIGVGDLMQVPSIMASLSHLGYPDYFATILGVGNLLGAVAAVAPGLRRAKEWAYAGMFFVLTGAATSHAVVGDAPHTVLLPLLLLGVVLTSWALIPAREARIETHMTAGHPAM